MAALTFCTDLAPAGWLAESALTWDQLVSFGPGGFAAYARLRFMPDPEHPGQSENSVKLPDDHRSDLEQSRAALDVLARFSTTPDDCYFCVWEGYSDVPLPPEATEDLLVVVPHRRYALYRGGLTALDVGWWAGLGEGMPVVPPAFVWPADHAWCLASDVDPHWAGIGASRAAVDALLAVPDLDMIRADPAEPQPFYR